MGSRNVPLGDGFPGHGLEFIDGIGPDDPWEALEDSDE